MGVQPFKPIYDKLSLCLTNRCNASCEICCNSCSPENGENLRLELAEKALLEARELPGMKAVAFTGGEPFLYPDKLLTLASVVKSCGFPFSVYTNGFWGRDVSAAGEYLTKLKASGLKLLSFSADKWHQAYVPARHLRAAIEAALSAGIFCRLSVVETAHFNMKGWVRENLGEDLWERLAIFSYPVMPAGRARSVLPHEEIWRFQNPAGMGCVHCGFIQLAPNGDYYMCCGMVSRDVPLLRLGNAADMSLKDVLPRILANDFLCIMLLEGWSWFAREVRARGFPFPEKVAMPCECCPLVFNNQELLSCLKEAAVRHAAELRHALARNDVLSEGGRKK